jgi:predicted RNase H-like HicB family nuclease
MQRRGYIVLTYEFYQEDDQWVGTCRELGTSVCADTREEAMEDLQEAVGVHLNTLEDVGERKRFFRDHKIKYYHTRPAAVKSRPTVRPGVVVEKQCIAVSA